MRQGQAVVGDRGGGGKEGIVVNEGVGEGKDGLTHAILQGERRKGGRVEGRGQGVRGVGRGEERGGRERRRGRGERGRRRINEKPVCKGKETSNTYAKVQIHEWISMH